MYAPHYESPGDFDVVIDSHFYYSSYRGMMAGTREVISLWLKRIQGLYLGSGVLTIRSSLISGVWGILKVFSQSLLDLSLVPWDNEMNLTSLLLEQGSVLCLPLFR